MNMPIGKNIQWIIGGLFLVVVLIVGYLLIADLFMSECVTPKSVRTKAELQTLKCAVNMFKLDTDRYPSQEKGLIELVQEPANVTGWNPEGYLETRFIPKDNWGQEFIYILAPTEEIPFIILSLGADGKPGGANENADLYSTDVQ